jgi:hypothetical protein
MRAHEAASRRGEHWYRQVHDEYATMLLAYFLRRVDGHQAHDLVAAVFLVAWRRREPASCTQPAASGTRVGWCRARHGVVQRAARPERRCHRCTTLTTRRSWQHSARRTRWIPPHSDPRRAGDSKPTGGPPDAWQGFAPTTPVFLLERMTTDRQVFGHYRRGADGTAAWYRRQPQPVDELDRALAVAPAPRLPRDGGGFTRVRGGGTDPRGTTRWTAPETDAELDFLGPLAVLFEGDDAPADARVEVTVDRDRRVTAVRVDDDAGARLRIGMFDRLARDRLPSPDVPGATAAEGMYADVCGAAGAAEDLRREVRRIVDGTDGVARFAFVGPTFAEPVDEGPLNEPVYGVAVRFSDDADPERTYRRVSKAVERLGVDREAQVCRTGTVQWLELDGPPG